jgi:HEAT repeat protein
MRRVLFALLVAVPAVAFASSGPARDRVIALLRSIETPPTPARLDEANDGESAEHVLLDIVDDEKVHAHARWQAVSELAQYPSAATESRLRQLIDQGRNTRTGAATLLARSAALSLAEIARARAVAQIAPLLDHPVPDVRADAARALGITRSQDALPSLRQRRLVESSAMVKTEIIEAINSINSITPPTR